MKKAIKYYISGFLSAMLLTSAVYAEPIQKELHVVYANVKIYIDGKLIDLKDANNQLVQPLNFNGTTYLPVRTIANVLGKSIRWDEKLKAVHIGEDLKSSIASPAAAGQSPEIAGCDIFPGDNFWNTPVDQLPVNPKSDDYINSIGRSKTLHPDFGTVWEGNPIGIPYNVVPEDQPKVKVSFDYEDESDNVLYPIPENPLIEAGSDRHILIVQKVTNILYELYNTKKNSDGTWHAGSGAVWHLDQNEIRPKGWTSADAAGLAILPGLVRYDEVNEKGEIQHALRVTLSKIQKSYISPASHTGGRYTDPQYPPMGLRLRLKQDFSISGYDPKIQVILKAMKKYGLVVADVGSDMYISGVPDKKWNDDVLGELKKITADSFEAVYTGDAVNY